MPLNQNAGTELVDFNDNLTQTQVNVREVEGLLGDAAEVARDVESALETFARIEKQADSIADTIGNLETVVRLVEKVGPLKVFAQALRVSLDKMEDAARSVEVRARRIDEKLEPVKQKVEKAREAIENAEGEVEAAGDDLEARRASAQAVETALNSLPSRNSQPAGPFVAGIANAVDLVVEIPNDVVETANAAYADTRNQALTIVRAVDTAALNVARELEADLNAIVRSLADVAKPLAILNDVLSPVRWALDAADFVFNTVVRPVLDPVLEALGVTRIFDAIADKLTELLPDVGILDAPQRAIEEAVDALVPDVDIAQLLGADRLRDSVTDFLDGAIGQPRFVIGTEGNETLTGGADDDVVSGGGGDDILIGGDGDDVIVGGAGNDTINGGSDTLVDPNDPNDAGGDRAIFRGSIDEYLIEFLPDGVSVRITHADPDSALESDDTDTLVNIEYFIFDGTELSFEELERGIDVVDPSDPNETFVRNGTVDRDFFFGTGQSNSVTFNGGAGDDNLVGGLGDDELFGGEGDDVLDGGEAGNDDLYGGAIGTGGAIIDAGIDTATFLSRTDGLGIRIQLDNTGGTAFTSTATVVGIENIIGSNGDDIVLGLDNPGTYTERLTGEAGTDLLRGFGGDDRLEGGAGDDILIGDGGQNDLIGGAGNDLFLLGAGTNDIVDGGAGEFDAVDYSGSPTALADNVRVIGSDFTAARPQVDRDGWTQVNGLAAPGVTPTPSATPLRFDYGGAATRPGYVRTNDGGGTSWFAAPEHYAGDRADFYGGTLSFWLYQFETANPGTDFEEVVLVGGGMTIGIDLDPGVPPHLTWTLYEIELSVDAGWASLAQTGQAQFTGEVTEADMRAVLADLDGIYIRGEYYNGTDSTGLDDVRLEAFSADAATTPFSDTDFLAEAQAVIDFDGTDADTDPDAPVEGTPNALTVDFANGTVEHRDGAGTLVSTDTLVSIESVTGGAQDDTFLMGAAEATTTYRARGGAGDDTFVEGVGRQIVEGGAGNDTVVVTSDAFVEGERFDGNEGDDTLDLTGPDDTRWRVDVPGGFLARAGAEEDLPEDGPNGEPPAGSARVRSFETIRTGEGADEIVSAGGRVFSGAGTDDVTIVGPDGGTIITHDLTVAVRERGEDADEVTNLSSGSVAINTGRGADRVTTVGASQGESVTVTTGFSGYTPLEDEPYEDGDLIEVGDGAITINAGDGADTVSYAVTEVGGVTIHDQSAIVLNLTTGAASGGAAGHVLNDVENVLGTTSGDNIIGSIVSNQLVGGMGNDTLSGFDQDEVLNLSPADQARLADDDDVLYGNEGNDTLNGRDGDDLLHGGAGLDVLSGGQGVDTASYDFVQEHPIEGRETTPELIASVNVDLARTANQAVITRRLYAEDFEDGAFGYVDTYGDPSVVDSSAALTDYKRVTVREGSHRLDLTIGEGVAQVDGTFDAYVLNSTSASDRIGVGLGNAGFSFSTNATGQASGTIGSVGSWTATRVDTGGANLDGVNVGTDEIWSVAFTLTRDPADTTLQLRFSDGANTADLGVDNIVISYAEGAETLASIEGVIGGGLDDELRGDDGDNALAGGDGDDLLIGRGGNDVIVDGFGADTVIAGAGDDEVVAGGGRLDGTGDDYDGNAGTDTLDYSGLEGSVTVDVENGTVATLFDRQVPVWADTGTSEARTVGTLFAVTPGDVYRATTPEAALYADDAERDFGLPAGEDAADLIRLQTVTTAATDTIAGFETIIGTETGDDRFYATANADDFDGGDAEPEEAGDPRLFDDLDTIDFSRSTASVNADLRTDAFSGGYAENGSYVGFSDVVGTAFDDRLVGDEAANRLIGIEGNNVLIGFDGDDVLTAERGYTTFNGGNGNDTIVHNVNLFAAVQGDGAVANLGAGDDSFQIWVGGSYNVTGGAGNDSIRIYEQRQVRDGPHRIDAGDGDDEVRFTGRGTFNSDAILIGGAGNDTLFLDEAVNVAALANGTFTQTGSEGTTTGVTVLGFENLRGAGGDDTFAGDAGDNVLDGGEGNNSLGGAAGNDTLIAGSGNDSYNGGAGIDTAVFVGTARVVVDLASGTATGLGNDTLSSIENVRGTGYGDDLAGDGGANVLEAGIVFEADGSVRQSSDVLSGLGGDDTLIDWNDVQASGGGGDDTIRILAEGEVLRGFVFGEAGIDTLELATGEGVDVNLTASTARRVSDDVGITTISNVENVSTGAGDDVLIGNESANVLSGGAGDDELRGEGPERFVGVGLNTAAGETGDRTQVGFDMPGNAVTYEIVYDATGQTYPANATVLPLLSYAVPGGSPQEANALLIEGVLGNRTTLNGVDTIRAVTFASSDSVPRSRVFTSDIPTSELLEGGPHRFSATFDMVANEASFYIDGVLRWRGGATDETGDPASVIPFPSGGTLVLGQEQDAVGGGFDPRQVLRGEIADIRVFDTVRTDAEIAAEWDRQIEDPANEPGLVANWRRESVSNATLVDVAGAADMTSIGTPARSSFLLGASPVASDDVLNGGEGNDLLEGGGGADVLDGGDGIDTITYENARGTGVTINLAAAAASGGEATGDTLIGIENVTGSDLADVLFGGRGDNVLRGLGGDDVLNGADGADLIDGGGGTDQARYNGSSAGVAIDLSQGTAGGGHAAGDELRSIENLLGSNFSDVLTGSAVANTIEGLNGDDTIEGLGGDDTLVGGNGADTLRGGLGMDVLRGDGGDDLLLGGGGADFLDGGAGIDTVSYASAVGGVRLNFVQGGSAGEAANDVFVSVENARGSNFNDVISANNAVNDIVGARGDDILYGLGGNDTLDGSIGNDRLLGGAGADTLVGGQGRDTASYASAASGVAIDLRAGGGGTAGEAAGDTFSGIESAIGSNHSDTLIGFAGINALFGGGGNDTLDGLGGNDTLRGDTGDDTLIGGAGNDRLEGGAGIDTYVFEAGSGRDRVVGFEDNVDKFDFTGHSGVNGMGDLEIRQLGTSAVIDINAGGVIIVNGAWGQVEASDFLF